MSPPAQDSAGFPGFLSGDPDEVAERLLGCFFERQIDGRRMLVRIVETEAYDQEDPASHSFAGPTPRNEVMFGESGRLYVYLSYGIHHCCNVVCGPAGFGAAALIRAVEPIEGTGMMERRREVSGPRATNGPGKLCQALAIDRRLGAHDLRNEPLRLLEGGLLAGETVTRTTRIGITKAADRLRRYYVTGNAFISKR